MDDPLDQWGLWMRAAGASAATVRTRVKGVRALCAHAGDVDPLELTELHVVAWLAGHDAPWTRRTYAFTARQWHRWLVERGIRDDDPTERLRMPPRPRSVPRPASTRSLDAVLELASRRGRAYIVLAAYAGLRVHEIAQIRGEDFTDGWLYVRGKGNDVDAVPVHPALEQLRGGWPATGWWFPSPAGPGHVKADTVGQVVSRTFRKAGHRHTAHQLRHWFGTHTLRVSKDLRVAQELLRHRSVASTQIYTEVADHDKQHAVRMLRIA